jgi:ribonuclease Z
LQCWLAGTGTPAVLDGRMGPATIIRAGDDLIMVDAGNGCAYQLLKLGMHVHELTHIFITHHHLDHNVDLGFLLIAPWIHGTARKPPLVVGPPGTAEYLNRIFAAHDYDVRSRLPHGYDPGALAVSVLEVEDGLVLDFGRWTVEAVEVDHHPVDQAFGYAFQSGLRKLVVSGDTRRCPRLIEAAKDADVLVHEVLFPGWGIPEYHTSVHEVGGIAAAANVDRLVLTHLIPGHLPDSDWTKIVRSDFRGDLVVGRDLLEVCNLGQ